MVTVYLPQQIGGMKEVFGLDRNLEKDIRLRTTDRYFEESLKTEISY